MNKLLYIFKTILIEIKNLQGCKRLSQKPELALAIEMNAGTLAY